LTDDEGPSPALTEAEWEFEEILGWRKRGRVKQVLVKWAGFEEPTWEPSRNFVGTETLRAYKAQHGE
jgi:hypothetical protein